MVGAKSGKKVHVDLNYRIPLRVTAKKDGMEYLLASYNKNLINLFPLSPIFISRGSEIYLRRLGKELEKNTAVASRSNYEIFSDRFHENKYMLCNDKSIKVAEELFTLSAQKRFDYLTRVCDMREEDFKKSIIEELQACSLERQNEILGELLARFTRHAEEYGIKLFLKSRGAVLQDGLSLVSKSITGLYEYKKERKL